jgi:hypothetical protein
LYDEWIKNKLLFSCPNHIVHFKELFHVNKSFFAKLEERLCQNSFIKPTIILLPFLTKNGKFKRLIK